MSHMGLFFFLFLTQTVFALGPNLGEPLRQLTLHLLASDLPLVRHVKLDDKGGLRISRLSSSEANSVYCYHFYVQELSLTKEILFHYILYLSFKDISNLKNSNLCTQLSQSGQ